MEDAILSFASSTSTIDSSATSCTEPPPCLSRRLRLYALLSNAKSQSTRVAELKREADARWERLAVESEAIKKSWEAKRTAEKKETKWRVSPFIRDRYRRECDQYWDRFYKMHQANFFKDRHYLHREWGGVLGQSARGRRQAASAFSSPSSRAFISKVSSAPRAAPTFVVNDLFCAGCGVGNAVFPLLHSDPGLYIYAADFSKKAVSLLQSRLEGCPAEERSRCKAFVADISAAEVTDLRATLGFTNNCSSSPPPLSLHFVPRAPGVDAILLLFVLSAIPPERHVRTVCNLWTMLRPGGRVLFRDYAKSDMAQLRFNPRRQLDASGNLFARQDGTVSYFFGASYLRKLFENAGRDSDRSRTCSGPEESDLHRRKGFRVEDIELVRRDIENRQQGETLQRCWIQGTFVRD